MAFAALQKKYSIKVDYERLLHKVSRFVPLRHRYVLTRRNSLRLRYSLPIMAGFAMFFISAALPVMTDALSAAVTMRGALTVAQLEPSAGAEHGAVQQDLDYALRNLEMRNRRLARYIPHLEEDADQMPQAVLRPDPKPKERIVEIDSGDTLAAVLDRAGISAHDIHQLAQALTKFYDPRAMKPGQKLSLHFDPGSEGGDYNFASMDLAIDPLKTVSLHKNPEGSFDATVKERPTTTRQYAYRTSIEHSLYGSALKAGIPTSIVAETIRIYSWDIDFQRDIRQGDAIEVLYEQVETEDGIFVKQGEVLYARLKVNGQDVPIYRFENSAGDVDYYTPDGASIRKALMSTPIDGARLSSGFGMRKHPVLGYTKMHKGTDFAAPRGTPVYAAGDGTIEKLGRWGAYGNYVRIRHNSSIKTAYAHLNSYGKGLSAGSRVRQGQIIGYVGTTGRSTGPHLHYEVLVNNTQVNPRTVKLPQQGENLTGKELVAFKAHIQELNQRYAELTRGIKYAALMP